MCGQGLDFYTQRGSSSEVGSFPQTNSGQSFVFLVLSPANSKLQSKTKSGHMLNLDNVGANI